MNKENIYTLSLSGMKFTSHHGCREDEKQFGNEFIVDVTVTFTSDCALNDELERTIDCSSIYSCVAKVMNGESLNLIETLASRIAEKLESSFPTVSGASVTVAKKNPPLAGPCAESKVTVDFKRS